MLLTIKKLVHVYMHFYTKVSFREGQGGRGAIVIVLPFLFTVSRDHCWIVYQVILSTVIFLVALPIHTHCMLYRQTRESEKLKVVQSLDDWRLSLPVPSMFRIHVNQLVALKVTCNWH